jgi:hypothetical protein
MPHLAAVELNQEARRNKPIAWDRLGNPGVDQ